MSLVFWVHRSPNSHSHPKSVFTETTGLATRHRSSSSGCGLEACPRFLVTRNFPDALNVTRMSSLHLIRADKSTRSATRDWAGEWQTKSSIPFPSPSGLTLLDCADNPARPAPEWRSCKSGSGHWKRSTKSHLRSAAIPARRRPAQNSGAAASV